MGYNIKQETHDVETRLLKERVDTFGELPVCHGEYIEEFSVEKYLSFADQMTDEQLIEVYKELGQRVSQRHLMKIILK